MQFAYRRLLAAWLIGAYSCFNALAIEHGPNDVYVRVIDVGQGLCCVASAPGDHYMIYDAGVGSGEAVFQAIAQSIPSSSNVDLLVLSHTDADHLAAVPEIMEGFHVKTAWRPDHQPGSDPGEETDKWKNARDAIKHSDCYDPGLDSGEAGPGTVIQLGEATITMVCGFTEPPDDWHLSSKAERRNAGSIVVRLDYKGKSVLFCGDTVGRHINDPPDTCIAAEQYMVSHSSAVPLRSDVIIVPHHGGDNGSSKRFIEAVKPNYVVFSAGHNGSYRHPWASTAQRYLNFGVPIDHMFRTDLGDDEGEDEWDYGRIPGNHDEPWDDEVDIVLRDDGKVFIEYASPTNRLQHERLFAERSEARLDVTRRLAAESKAGQNKASSKTCDCVKSCKTIGSQFGRARGRLWLSCHRLRKRS